MKNRFHGYSRLVTVSGGYGSSFKKTGMCTHRYLRDRYLSCAPTTRMDAYVGLIHERVIEFNQAEV